MRSDRSTRPRASKEQQQEQNKALLGKIWKDDMDDDRLALEGEVNRRHTARTCVIAAFARCSAQHFRLTHYAAYVEIKPQPETCLRKRRERKDEMNSRAEVLLIVLTLFWFDPLIAGSHAQQAQAPTAAVQLIGAGVKEKTKGKLTVVNGRLRFIHDKGSTDVPAASIQDVVTGSDSQRVIGGTFGTIAQLAAPFGTGRVLSLFRTKLETLTIKYRDADGGLHGVIFTVPLGKAEMIKQELLAQGARTSIPTQAEPKSETKEKKP